MKTKDIKNLIPDSQNTPILKLSFVAGRMSTYGVLKRSVLDSGGVGLRPTSNGFGTRTPLGT